MSSSIKYSPINDQRTLSETSSLTSSVQLNTTQPKNDVLVINTLTRLNRDSYLLFLGKSLRLFSFGFLAVMLVIYLQQLGFGLESIGLLFTWYEIDYFAHITSHNITIKTFSDYILLGHCLETQSFPFSSHLMQIDLVGGFPCLSVLCSLLLQF